MHEIRDQLNNKAVQLLIVDIMGEAGAITQHIKELDLLLLSQEQSQEPFFLTAIINPFSHSAKEVLSVNQDQECFKNNPELFSGIIPNQSWQFNRGQLDPEFTQAEKVLSFSFYFDSDVARVDQIKNFSMQKGQIGLISNRWLADFVIFREICFKLERLPKFGA